MPVHHWLRLLAFPMRTSAFANGQTWDLPVPAQGASTHARFFDPAGPPSLAISCLAVLPSAFETASAPRDIRISWLNGWPAPSPTDASSTSLRTATHGSGPT